MSNLQVSYQQAVRYRLQVNHLTERLQAGSYLEGAYFGLQDTAPRDALLGMHARVQDCEPTAWEHPDLIQTYSPRGAVYVLPMRDFGIFTVGRLPLDLGARRELDELTDRVCQALGGEERRGGVPDLRTAGASGRIALRWTTSALYARELPRPEIDFEEAHRELCRRHVQAFGPTTPEAFAWWSGLSPKDAREVWRWLADELLPVDLAGHPAWILAKGEEDLRRENAEVGTGAGGEVGTGAGGEVGTGAGREVATERKAGGEAVGGAVVRLVVAPDLRVFGQDRWGLFVGPGMKRRPPLHDSFHPNGVVVGGEIVGAWGRRGGRVQVKVQGPLREEIRAAITAEALSMPIPDAVPSVEITEY